MVPSQPPNRCTQSHATWWSSAGCPLGPMTSEQMGHCCHTQVLWGKCLHCGLSCSSWLPPLPARKQPANLLPFPGRPFLQIWLYCQGPALRRCSVHFVGHSKHHLPKTKEMTLQMDITRWSISKSNWLYSLQPKMEKLYIVSKKQDLELTAAQTISSLLQNSGLNWRKWGKQLDNSGMT